MSVIDAHCHAWNKGFLPRRHLEHTAFEWAYARPPYRDPADIIDKIEPGLIDPDGEHLIAQMDEAGIDVAVLLTLDYGPSMGQDPEVGIDEQHAWYASLMERYPGRVLAFAGPDPQRSDALDLFNRAIDVHHLRGLKMYPSAGFFPYEPRCYPFYERCQAEELPVVAHIAPSGSPHRSRYAHPLGWGDVVVDFPDLVLWWGHAGWPLWFDECLEVMKRHYSSYLEFSLWQRAVRTDEEAFVKVLARARDTIGAHRMIWASDAQYSPRLGGERALGFGLKPWVEWFQQLPLTAKKYGCSFTDDEVELILGKNAARCLGLDDDPTMKIGKLGWGPREPRPVGL